MEYKVKPEEDGRKVRDILRGSMGVSYTALKSAKWNGRIFLNRETVRADAKVSAGDTVEIEWAEDTPVYALKPFDMPVEVPWEDEHLIPFLMILSISVIISYLNRFEIISSFSIAGFHPVSSISLEQSIPAHMVVPLSATSKSTL